MTVVEDILFAAAVPYLNPPSSLITSKATAATTGNATVTPGIKPGVKSNLIHIFEAAHSLTLAILAAPQNVNLTIRILPFYVETLLAVGRILYPFPNLPSLELSHP